METGSSVDFLRLTTAWYRTILSCCLYGVSHISSPIMEFSDLLKNLNEFTFMTNVIVVISELLPIA